MSLVINLLKTQNKKSLLNVEICILLEIQLAVEYFINIYLEIKHLNKH